MLTVLNNKFIKKFLKYLQFTIAICLIILYNIYIRSINIKYFLVYITQLTGGSIMTYNIITKKFNLADSSKEKILDKVRKLDKFF